jgi:threonine aldolase
MDFRSDNTHGASAEIVDALIRANEGRVTSYGEDAWTERVRERCSAIFETEVEVFPVVTGTAANAVAIAAMQPNAIYCHHDAHIHLEELRAAELFSGATMIPIGGAEGKLHASNLELRAGGCLSITQTTEAGTVYSLDELRALCEVARRNGCSVQMDGARFANAVASTNASPAELTWRAGVDVLSLGATKNGALSAEVIVLFDRARKDALAMHWHRAGQRLSKMRFVSAQLEAYLTGDLWLRNARHANAMAARLASGLQAEIVRPVDANIVFARFAPDVVASLQQRGLLFYDWPLFGDDVYRLVCGFSTTAEEVALIAAT